MTPTAWPETWSRTLRPARGAARQNAVQAAKVVHERRLEAERQRAEEEFLTALREGYGDPRTA